MYGLPANNYGLQQSVFGTPSGITPNQYGQALDVYNSGQPARNQAASNEQNLWSSLPQNSMYASQALVNDPAKYRQNETNLVQANGPNALTFNNGTALQSLAELGGVAGAFAFPFIAPSLGLGADASAADIGANSAEKIGSNVAGDMISGGQGTATLGDGMIGGAGADQLTTAAAGGGINAASLAGALSSFGGSSSSPSNATSPMGSMSAPSARAVAPSAPVTPGAAQIAAPNSQSGQVATQLPVYAAYQPQSQQALMAQALMKRNLQKTSAPVDPNQGLRELLMSGNAPQAFGLRG